jgi:hypothetical protein
MGWQGAWFTVLNAAGALGEAVPTAGRTKTRIEVLAGALGATFVVVGTARERSQVWWTRSSGRRAGPDGGVARNSPKPALCGSGP